MCLFLYVYVCRYLRFFFLVDNGFFFVKVISVVVEVLFRNGRSLDRKFSFKFLVSALFFLISVICGCVGIIVFFFFCIFEKKKYMG